MEGDYDIVEGEIVAPETGVQPTPEQASGQDQGSHAVSSSASADEPADRPVISLEDFLRQQLLIAGCPPMDIPLYVADLRAARPELDFTEVRPVHEWAMRSPFDE